MDKERQGPAPIRIPAQMLLKLQASYSSLKRAERSAADLLMSRPDFVATSAIGSASKAVGVSEPTFVRLARRLGYSGYSDLKAALLGDGAPNDDQALVPYADISPTSSAHDIAQSIVHASIQALNDLLCVMNQDDYERAAHALVHAKRIAFFGAGDSGVIAQSAFQKFLRGGAVCHTASDGDTQAMLCSLMDTECVCILISHSGDTTSIMQAAKLAKAAGATTIAVTNFPYSHLARLCDIVLLTATFVKCSGEVVTQRIAQLAIIESLFIIYRMRMGKVCDDALAITGRVLESTNKL